MQFLSILYSLPTPAYWAIGAFLIVIGLSYCYKGWNATVLGRCYYWAGFLPFTLVSPWFIHLPPGKNSLVKVREGILCHVFLGPLFFISAIICLLVGTDMIGLPGTDTANFILNAGNSGKAPAIIYSPPLRYNFPIVARAGKQINKIFNTQFYEDPGKSLLPGQHRTTRDLNQTLHDTSSGH
ncbi:MAG: hypothetical protein K8F91_16920 [Candidatus Obscuribacterales bacterium]|nr:hypothetical protein [Candidatus Obscuribacterales bacterium]